MIDAQINNRAEMTNTSSVILFSDSEKCFDPTLIEKLRKSKYVVIETGPDFLTFSTSGVEDIALIIFYNAVKNKDTLPAIKYFREICPSTPLLVISPDNSNSFIIESFKSGISDFLSYPMSHEKFLSSVAQNIGGDSSPLPSQGIPPSADSLMTRQFIGECRIMKEVKHRLLQIAETDATVLITGETGTGKDLAAEYIHCSSKRYRNPFVPVNCTALPEGLFESELFGYEKGAFTGAYASRKGKFELAEGGTLFLDEIGDMPLHLQAKLLHVIEKKSIFRIGGKREIPVDVKIIAATNRNIEKAVQSGKFRIDLYYRLNVANIFLPPLRERKDDLKLLIAHITKKMTKRYHPVIMNFSDEDMALMHGYGWPGNVRELQNIIEMCFINLLGSEKPYLELLPELKELMSSTINFEESERQQLVSALLASNWNKTETARKLSWSRMTVHRKINKYNIVQKRNRSDPS